MRVLRRWSTIALAAAAAAAAFTAPAAAGSASAGGAGINAIVAVPADCILATTGELSRSLTCSNRPAGQQWRLLVTCNSIWVGDYDFAYGTIVTGNGTSSASCWRFTRPVDRYNRFETLS
jgi:hypothetical protein